MLEDVVEAVEGEAVSPRFGQGDLPEDLDRLNWSAVFLGILWALLHGTWGWFAVLGGIRLATIPLSMYVMALRPSWGLLLIWVVLATLLEWGVAALFGFRANRAAWEAEAKRIATGRHQPPALTRTVAQFKNSQRALLWVGIILTAIGYPLSVATSEHPAARPLPTLVGVVCTIAILAALLFLDRRIERPS